MPLPASPVDRHESADVQGHASCHRPLLPIHAYNVAVYGWVRDQVNGLDLTAPTSDELPPLPDQGELLDPARLPRAIAAAVAQGALWAKLTWEEEFGTWPSEAEVLCHVTVPLLVALGWPATQIAVEWRRRDVALFSSLERAPENCRVVLEGKIIGRGLHSAREQVDRYARESAIPSTSPSPTDHGFSCTDMRPPTIRST